MPSKTAKQARFMAMCAHSPGSAKGKCPPKSVAREFNQADQAKRAGFMNKMKRKRGRGG